MSLPHRSALALAIAALLSSPAFGADYAALPQSEVAQAVAHGATVVHDYGSFAWVRGSGRGADAQATYALDLGGRSFDPAVDTAARAAVYGNGPALRLVQFDGPLRQEWLGALRGAGVQPLQYIAPFAYVVWADEAALSRARGISALRWSGDFLPEYKQANVPDGLRRSETEWHAMVYRGARVSDAAFAAAGATVLHRAQIDATFDIVGLQAASTAMEQLALLPGVYTLQPVPRDGGKRAELANQITANNLNGSNLPVPGYLGWLTTVGITGSGVKIANVDGGIYDTHPDLVNRMLPCVGDTCGGSAVDDHGSHTAAIMAGDGTSGVNDPSGFRRGLGMAPGANLIEQVYSPTFTQAGGMLKLMRQSQDNGADLSGNSWGPSGSPQGYDADTRQVDVGTRDTKPDVAGDQPLTFVLSFMNGGGGTSSQGTPDEAKNVITVGSTKGQNGNLSVIPQFNDVSSNSAHGPALDGRRIPHMVAPGCEIDSVVSATGYGTMCGTSMASPQVSGAVALFIQKYRLAHAGASPSTALIKAALVAASMDLNGNTDANGNPMAHRPDNKQGWGRLRADWLINSAVPVLYYDQNTRVFDNTGEDWNLSVAPADPSKPVQLVLVYTDAPGHGLGGSTPAWNNDLDLQVIAGATTYRGNVFGANGYSIGGGSADNRNNIESVWLDAATASAAGAMTVRVVASNITSDALPNAGDATDQDFALVCTNCVSQPDYTVTAGTAQAVCTATTSTASYPVGIGSLMGYSSPVNLSLTGLPAGANGSVTPAAVTPPGSASVGLTALNAVAPGNYSFQLNTASASGNRSRDIGLSVANATPPAVPLVAPAINANNVSVRPVFSWTAAAQASEYTLELASDSFFINVVHTLTVSGTTATLPVDLNTSSLYFWRVWPANICGRGTSTISQSFTTAAAPGDCGPGTSPNVLLSNSVEGGQGAWVTSAGAGTANWAISTARPYGGTGSSWLAQNPAVTSDQRLTSPAIALPSGQSPLTLQFQSDQTMESDGSSACWDGGFLEISTNGGGTYTAIPAAAMLTDPYNGPLGDGNPAEGMQAWCGDPQAYLRSVVNLDAYAGQTVQLRFRLVSDNLIGRLPNGWYVDDIKVQSCRAPQPDAIFDDGFDPQP
jgi:serine protease AprX